MHIRKTICIALTAVLALFSQAALALGLGTANVRSYLGEGLNTRIELINASVEELNSMTADLASAADIERLGLSRVVSVPLHFRVNVDADDAYIEVTSRLPVNEPVVQLVLQVQWSGGRMLREYNLFIDPPTRPSRAPGPRVVQARPLPSPVAETYPDPNSVDVIETDRPTVTAPSPRPSVTAPPEPEVPVNSAVSGSGSSDEVAQEPVANATASAGQIDSETVTVPADHLMDTTEESNVTPADQEAGAPMSALPGDASPASPTGLESDGVPTDSMEVVPGESESEGALTEEAAPAAGSSELTGATPSRPEAETAEDPQRESSGFESEGIHGPVQRGETLWGIASRYTRGTDFSINQAMLAIQRLNPEAFGGNNINYLKRGAILRLPSAPEVDRLDRRQAMLEAMRQAETYRAMRAGEPYDDVPPLLADAALEVAAAEPVEAEPNSAPGTGQSALLELVPPSEGEPAAGGGGDAEAQATGALSSDELEEVLARTEEELANAQQENAYLAERIRELEAQLGGNDERGAVENNELAALESGLREQRLDAAQQSPAVQDAQTDAQAWTGWPWLIGLGLLLVGGLAWVLRRWTVRSGDGVGSAAVREDVGGIRSDAEEILETLGDSPTGEGGTEHLASGGDHAPRSDRKAKPADDTEVIELDSDDPETQLDLARAYISMGDPEAARAMLESVLEKGNEAQVIEAREMMREL